MNRLNIGVIGAGFWGKKIIQEYTELAKGNEDLNITSVCDINEENLHYCKENFGVNICHNYMDILNDPKVDGINICTPNETHYQICAEALNANKHVLLEKPMTLRSSEAYELVELSEKRGLILSVGHIFRFNNALRKVKNLIKEGLFGELYYLDLQWTTLYNPPNRNIITDLAPHPFDILNFLTEIWPKTMTCIAKGYRNGNREEVAFIISEFENNVIGHMYLSWLMPGKIRLVRISGSKKAAEINCLSQEVNISDGKETHNVKIVKNNTIRSELTHFLECIRNNNSRKLYNRNDGFLGAHVVGLLEAAIKSHKECKTVPIDFPIREETYE